MEKLNEILERAMTEETAYWIEQAGNMRQERDDALAECARLRKGIEDYVHGDYEPRIKKMEKCKHGHYGYEICEACIDEHFISLLNRQ